MSGGLACSRDGHAMESWVVIQRNGNASAFNGYHWQRSEYSEVCCLKCLARWRTKAAYVRRLRDAEPGEWLEAHNRQGGRQ